MSTSALIQVFGNTTLLHQVTAFTPGVPYFVIQFKEPEYTDHVNQTTVLDEWSRQVDLTLWKVTILCNKRVISALNDLSEIPTYEFNRHVQLTQVMMFALTHPQDLVLLNWLEENLFKQHQQCIRYQLRKDITQLGSSAILIVWWLAVKRNYASTAEWMGAAARRGNLELVCYFLETETMPTCTPTTLSYAAGSGNLELVRYLHEDITEGWTTGVMNLAAVNRHLEIVKFLHENRDEGCTSIGPGCAMERGHSAFYTKTAIQGVALIQSTGLRSEAGSAASIAQEHLEIVKFLHENQTDGCSVTALFEAEGISRSDRLSVSALSNQKPSGDND